MLVLFLQCLLLCVARLAAPARAQSWAGQPINILRQPQELWRSEGGQVLDDNGVYVSPDGEMVVSTSENGHVYAFDAVDGEVVWDYLPQEGVRCNSGIAFSYRGAQPYLVYSIVEDPFTINAASRIIGLSTTGERLWSGLQLEGTAAGTPVVSNDGRYIFLTHNSNDHSVGHFTVYDTQQVEYSTIFPIYSEFNRTNPFSPPGIYYSPSEGYYEGGESNRNDLVAWSFAPQPTNGGQQAMMNGATGSALFVFQFPIGFQQDSSISPGRLGWRYFGFPNDDWRSISAPVLTNSGRSMYWSVSRSEFRAWVGEYGAEEYRFDTNNTVMNFFEMGFPPMMPSPNTPALSANPIEPDVYAGTAGLQFVRMNFVLDQLVTRNVTSEIKARAMVSPDERFVYFTEYDGYLHIAHSDNLTDAAMVSEFFGQLDGDFAMRSDGTVLYVGDTSGEVTAIRVGNLPTPSPTRGPTRQPTSPTPSDQPSSAPSSATSLLAQYSHPCGLWLLLSTGLVVLGQFWLI